MRSRLHRTTKGSNQYKAKERLLGMKLTTWKSFNIVAILLLPVIVFGHQAAVLQPVKLVSPIAQRAFADDLVTPVALPPLAPIKERDQVIAMIRRVWGKDASVGLAIARCESGYRVTAVNRNTNGTRDEGVFQINTVHQMPDMLNGTANILYGHQMYEQQGLGPWQSSKSCWGGLL